MGTIPENNGKVTANPQSAVDEAVEVEVDDSLADPFARVPHLLARDPSLGDKAFRLWVVLMSHARWDTRTATLWISTIAAEMGCGYSSVQRAQRELVKRGLLQVTSGQKTGQRSAYRLFGPRASAPPDSARGEGGSVTHDRGGRSPMTEGVGHQRPTEQDVFNENQSTRVLSAPNGATPTSDPLKKCAHRLTVKAMERTHKPVIARASNPFPAVLKLTESLLRAGWTDKDIERVYTTDDRVVWTVAGLQAALEKHLRTDRARQTERARPRSEHELLMDAREATLALLGEDR